MGLHHLNMEELIRDVGVPRSSAFAAFGGKDELITELMVQSLHPDDPGPAVVYSPSTVTLAQEVFAAHAHRLSQQDGSPDPTGQETVLEEIVRVVLRANVEEITASTQWRTYMALSVSARGLPDGRRERVLDALHRSESHFIDQMSGIYETLLGPLGRRPIPGLTARHVATAGAAVVEGIVSRRLVGSADADAEILRPGPDGEPVPWHLGALAFLAMVHEMTERVDDTSAPVLTRGR